MPAGRNEAELATGNTLPYKSRPHNFQKYFGIVMSIVRWCCQCDWFNMLPLCKKQTSYDVKSIERSINTLVSTLLIKSVMRALVQPAG